MEKTIKLSDKQKEVIKLMRQGYDLRSMLSTSNNSQWDLRKDNDVKDVNTITARSLKSKGLIRQYNYFFPSRWFCLTDLAATIDI